jgi:Flp pilus assembly secretin CpaC
VDGQLPDVQPLAEPSMVPMSGQQTELLSGGGLPIPVAQNNNRITIEHKEYGIKLVFMHTVLAREVVDMHTTTVGHSRTSWPSRPS